MSSVGNLTAEEQEQYAAENKGLAYHFVHKYKNPFNDEDELISEAMLGLTKALRGFDKTKGVKFSTYASTCIVRAIKVFQAEQAKKGPRISLDNFMENKDGETFNQEPASDEDIESVSVLRLLVEDVISQESERNAEVLRLYLADKSYSEIAKIHGISKMRVSQIVRWMLEKIKNEYRTGDRDVN